MRRNLVDFVNPDANFQSVNKQLKESKQWFKGLFNSGPRNRLLQEGVRYLSSTYNIGEVNIYSYNFMLILYINYAIVILRALC